ncbi:MAG: SPOR domain-containing protein [Gammaproteobacteria bacterium]
MPRIELVAKSEPQQPAPARETAGYFMVQAGTFAAVEKATELRDRLRARGFNTSLFPVTVDGRPLYRVRVGPQASRAESEQARDRLQRDLGVQGSIVPIN